MEEMNFSDHPEGREILGYIVSPVPAFISKTLHDFIHPTHVVMTDEEVDINSSPRNATCAEGEAPDQGITDILLPEGGQKLIEDEFKVHL